MAEVEMVLKYFSSGEAIEEELFSRIFHQLLTLMLYMYKKRIVVRQLDSSNIVFDGSNIKLLSLTNAHFFTKHQKFHEKVTGVHFVSPEMAEGKYTYKTDVWSLGVLAFILLTGKLHVNTVVPSEIEAAIKSRKFDFSPLQNIAVNPDLKKLILSMLNPNRRSRPSFKELAASQWYKELSDPRTSGFRRASIFNNNLKEFYFKNKFLRGIHAFLVKQTVSKEQRDLAAHEFAKLDINGDGCLDRDEIIKALTALEMDKVEEICDEIFAKLDANKSGKIEYTEFLELWVSRNEVLDAKNLRKYFDILDSDKNGVVSPDDLFKVFGDQIHTDYFKKYFRKYSKDNYLNYDEFLVMMKELVPKVPKNGANDWKILLSDVDENPKA